MGSEPVFAAERARREHSVSVRRFDARFERRSRALLFGLCWAVERAVRAEVPKTCAWEAPLVVELPSSVLRVGTLGGAIPVELSGPPESSALQGNRGARAGLDLTASGARHSLRQRDAIAYFTSQQQRSACATPPSTNEFPRDHIPATTSFCK